MSESPGSADHQHTIRLFSSLVNSVNGIMWECVPDTFQFSFVSQQAERILGYTAEQWCADKEFWINHTHPDDVEWCTQFCMTAVAERRDHEFEYRMIAADGSTVWLHDIVTVKVEPDGSVRLQGIMVDITERKQAEEALRKSESLWRTMFDNSFLGIALVNAEGYPVENNPALRRMLGYTSEELRRMTFVEFTHPEDIAKDLALFKELLAGKRDHYQIEKRYIRKDGQVLWVNLIVSIITDENSKENFVVGMVENITERKHLEEQLRQAQKMEAIGRLAGGVAHDFNNLLTAIVGYSSLLLARLEPDSPHRNAVLGIEQAGHRAASLTSQLLAFSRKQVLQPKILDLNMLLAESARMITRLIGEDIELVIDLAPELGRIKADPGQVEQIIMNLAVNARDAMPKGGKLILRTANFETGGADMRSDIPRGSYVKLSVSDTGVGMSAEIQARIFEPFFTTKEVGKGTGLGLATVYGIVKQSEGEIIISSEVGRGATFEIFFPLCQEPAKREKVSGELLPIQQGDETILLVEDEGAVRRLTKEVLEMCGYKVLEAADGARALRVCEQHAGPIHLMLTDVVMPQMSGSELAERIKHLRPGLPVLYISGYTHNEIGHHGVLKEGIEFLQKPFSPDDLARKVRQMLD